MCGCGKEDMPTTDMKGCAEWWVRVHLKGRIGSVYLFWCKGLVFEAFWRRVGWGMINGC